MNVLLVFFAIPIAVIVISIALQKVLKCPILVAAIIFSILLIIALILSNTELLVLVIIYTILSYLVAVITQWIMRIKCNSCSIINQIRERTQEASNQRTDNDVITINGSVRTNSQTTTDNSRTGTFCGCYRRR